MNLIYDLFLKLSFRCYGVILRFEAGLFKRQFLSWLVYATIRLQTVRLQTVRLHNWKPISRKYRLFKANQIREKCNIFMINITFTISIIIITTIIIKMIIIASIRTKPSKICMTSQKNDDDDILWFLPPSQSLDVQ